MPLYNKLRTLVDDDFELPNGGGKIKRGYTVWNEAMEETWLEKEEGESPNDRNDRGELANPRIRTVFRRQ